MTIVKQELPTSDCDSMISNINSSRNSHFWHSGFENKVDLKLTVERFKTHTEPNPNGTEPQQ